MSAPAAARLTGNRLHLQHGPIDLVIGAFGEPQAVEHAYHAAMDVFVDILPGLVSELPRLRQEITPYPLFTGPVARRMQTACLPFGRDQFITPMAAVAGAVADHVLQAMLTVAPLTRAYVNNGGDIALHLAPGASMEIGLIVPETGLTGATRISSDSGIRGIATSGRGGRSHSLGIAESVTVLAHSAALADAAATMIGNAVNAEHPAIHRELASNLNPDSDLGDRLVTVAVGRLPDSVLETAFASGQALARSYRRKGWIEAALISLQGNVRTIGTIPALPSLKELSA